MADLNSNQVLAQFAVTTEPEPQGLVYPPWADGSDPEVPIVDNDIRHVCLYDPLSCIISR